MTLMNHLWIARFVYTYFSYIIYPLFFSESLAYYYYDVQIVIQNNRDENSSLSEMAEIVVSYLDQNGYLKAQAVVENHST